MKNLSSLHLSQSILCVMLTKMDLSIEFNVGGFGTIISLVLLLAAIGILVFIARELDQAKKRKLSGIIFILLSILGYACYLVHYKLYRPDIISHEEIFAFIVLITWITNVTLLTSIYRISTEEQYTIKNTEVERKSTH